MTTEKKKIPPQDFFREGGELSRLHPRYDYRPQQEEMAEAVRKIIEDKGILMVEAGTGVGKSLAYLYPFALHALSTNKKVAISTGTKTLQRQLIEKDIPFLSESAGLELKSELCLGVNNYLCLYRLAKAGEQGLFNSLESAEQFQEIVDWSVDTDTGLQHDLDFTPRGDVWGAVRAESDFCLWKKCPFLEECFHVRAKKRREEADILVMNHHLFFANLAAGATILPQFNAVVLDEAHLLEDIATEFLGYEVSNYRIPKLLNYLYSKRTGKGFLPTRVKDDGLLEDWHIRIEELREFNAAFFSELEEKWRDTFRTVRIKEPNFIADTLSGPLGLLEDSLEDMKDTMTDDESLAELKTYIKRCRKIREELVDIITMETDETVYWYSREEHGHRLRQTLRMAPIEVGEYLKPILWENYGPVVLTSATISTRGDFSYLRKRLGLEDCRELSLSSPFDFENRVMLYTDSRIPDPGRRREEYEERIIQEVGRLIILSGGGVFALFTSFRMLNKAYERLSGPLDKYGCLRQGDKNRYALLEEFRSHPTSVLFGTTSFWQGVDVPGDSLKCVIITKLPFAVPNDPVTEARIDLIKERGGNPFREFQIPTAIIMLRQGFGRLMRHKEDYGIVAILDPRIRTRRYGKDFFSSLPACRVTSELAQLDKFMKSCGMGSREWAVGSGGQKSDLSDPSDSSDPSDPSDPTDPTDQSGPN
ncbi:MAG: ATP-dependent DNA helicase [Candidatus Auribacterota bacterium]|nr:ATP-dependent DNA helicase [Candidatus Auribacterota bacterium]